MGETDQTVAPFRTEGDASTRAQASSAPVPTDSVPTHSVPAQSVLASLTAKQRDVLDLLIDHQTSKEISRTLGISPHTVDQRIMLARAKLGVASRSEVAQAYRRLVADSTPATAIYEQSPAQDDMAAWQAPRPLRREAPPRAAMIGTEALAEPYFHVLPEMFDGPYGTYLRLSAIAVFALFLILIVLGGLAMYAQLSQIIAH
jgi:DNA-binding CsgD family transcriptional regulator